MKAVLDSNVIISALISGKGPPARILELWRAGDFEIVCSPMLLRELSVTLSRPRLRRYVPPRDAALILSLLRSEATTVKDPETPPSVTSVDADDDYLIALAEQSRSVLVSGDSDLLGLAGRIPVYSPRDFLALLLPET